MNELTKIFVTMAVTVLFTWLRGRVLDWLGVR